MVITKRGATGMSWISLRMLNVLKCTDPFYTSNKICLTQNTNSSAIKKHWAHTNDHSPHGLKVSRPNTVWGPRARRRTRLPAEVPWYLRVRRRVFNHAGMLNPFQKVLLLTTNGEQGREINSKGRLYFS